MKRKRQSPLSEEEKAARKAERDAAQSKLIQEYARKMVADLPPLSPEIISKVAVLLRPPPKK